MYLRDGVHTWELRKLADAIRAGEQWEDVRRMLPDVDPEALDRVWRYHIHELAGVTKPAPVVEEPPKRKGKG